MALNLLNGQMLNATLERDGVNLSVINTANSIPTLYLDVANNFVGINTSTTTAHLTIAGNAVAYNLRLSNSMSTAGNIYVTGLASVAGNACGANINTAGLVTATGNVYGGNILTAGQISAAGNATSNNLTVLNLANINTIVANIISITGNVTGTNLSLSGTVTANYIVSNLDISATGNIVGSQNLTLTGNVSAANTSLSGTITVPRITSSSNANITITPNGTGNLNLENIAVNNTTLSTISVGNLITFAGTTGIVLPVGNQIQRPSSPPAGTTRFNTTANDLETWNGSAWIVGNSGNLGQITDQQFNGDGTTTTFTLTHTSTTAATLVYINGVGQLPGISYTVTGNLITFNQAPLSADTIDIRFISYVTTIESITNDYGNSYVQVDDTPAINFVVAGNSAATINSTGVFQVQGSSLQLPTYNVAQTASIVSPQPGQVIYVSNGDSGAPTLAVYDGTSWKRVALGTTIST